MAEVLQRLKCKKCGYEWLPRIPNPKVCPRCKRYDWNQSQWEVEHEVEKSYQLPKIKEEK